MKKVQTSIIIIKQKKKIAESKASAKIQVVELGKASSLTLGGACVEVESGGRRPRK